MSAVGLRCWVLTDGKAGTENQCIGLAEAIGVEPVVKRVHPRAPWTWLPVGRWPLPHLALGADSDPVAPPWPDLLIASGRRSVPYALAIKRRSGAATFTIQVQDPRLPSNRFDMVAPPRHDHVRGANVVETQGALNRVTPARLAAAAAAMAARLSHLPRPLVAVLIGGSSNSYRLTPETARELGQSLAAMAGSSGAGLVVTPSRRTGRSNVEALRAGLGMATIEGSGTTIEIWDGVNPNPYFGYLGLADAIVVTCDSVSMTSEACSTGKPVHVVELPGGAAKFHEFHARLRAGGLTRPFTGTLERWSYEPLRDTAEVAAEVKQRLGRRLGGLGAALGDAGLADGKTG